jgi:predicted transporter
MHQFDVVIVALLIVGIGLYIWRHWRQRVRGGE